MQKDVDKMGADGDRARGQRSGCKILSSVGKWLPPYLLHLHKVTVVQERTAGRRRGSEGPGKTWRGKAGEGRNRERVGMLILSAHDAPVRKMPASPHHVRQSFSVGPTLFCSEDM